MLSGYASFDPKQVDQLRLQKNLSRKELMVRAGVAEKTGYRFFNRKPVQVKSARKIFSVLGVMDFTPYLEDQSSTDVTSPSDGVGEWVLEEVLSPWISLANRLQFRICKLRHSILENTWARGKCYDLEYLSTKDDRQTRECLTRHPKVCRLLSEEPGFLRNQAARYSDDGKLFWVIDDWINGVPLSRRIDGEFLESGLLPRIMRQIADCLQVLHQHGIIRRELTPDYVFIQKQDSSIFLTELELAKLLDGSPTVSMSWDANPYRAPEVEGSGVDYTADLYSWAQILVFACTGQTPPAVADVSLLAEANLPPRVRRIAVRCLALAPEDRPQAVSELTNALNRWR